MEPNTPTAPDYADNAAPSAPVPSSARRGGTARRCNAVIVIVFGAAWLALDILTKHFFNQYAPGDVIAGPYLGVFRFCLVHNTGAAWGIFSNSTAALGLFSLLVVVVLLVYVFVLAPDTSRLGAFGVALVVSGGIGNAIDRFTLGYVIDFIEPVFIDFPVFNIADIGVTCGIFLFLLAFLLEWRNEGDEA